MPYRIVTILFLLGMSLAVVQGADPPGPPATRSEVFKRFVDEFVPLTPGKGKFPARFILGTQSSNPAPEESPAMEITLPRPFAMAANEVTQELYEAVMGNNPSKWKGRRNSVEMVSWDEAVKFCKILTTSLREAKQIANDEVIRLPSEAEWEYACRAGTTTNWSFGNNLDLLDEHAWTDRNSKGYDPPVGAKKPNPWGLYDMHGYNWEWCADLWSDRHKGASTRGEPRSQSDQQEKRVIRGGSWGDKADCSRSAFRKGAAHDLRDDRIGFRCVKVKEITP